MNFSTDHMIHTQIPKHKKLNLSNKENLKSTKDSTFSNFPLNPISHYTKNTKNYARLPGIAQTPTFPPQTKQIFQKTTLIQIPIIDT